MNNFSKISVAAAMLLAAQVQAMESKDVETRLVNRVQTEESVVENIQPKVNGPIQVAWQDECTTLSLTPSSPLYYDFGCN